MNIKDIAKLAGVGVSTVSRALNNYSDVSDATREKVLKIVKENNYIPNTNARTLKQSCTKNIGILVKGIFNPFFSEIINKIAFFINDAGYTMILQQNYSTEYRDVDILKSFIRDKRLQGVICLGGDFSDIDENIIKESKVPIVLTSVSKYNQNYTEGYSYISIDDENAAYTVTKTLIDMGHKNIAIVIGEGDDTDTVGFSRARGYKTALKEAGLNVNDYFLIRGKYTSRDAYIATKEFLRKEESVTAMFAMSDIMAAGCARAVIDTGKSIGKDISIVGFDGMEVSEFYNPPIATVKQPKDEMANMSWELLEELMTNKSKNRHIILDIEFLLRESCKSKN